MLSDINKPIVYITGKIFYTAFSRVYLTKIHAVIGDISCNICSEIFVNKSLKRSEASRNRSALSLTARYSVKCKSYCFTVHIKYC